MGNRNQTTNDDSESTGPSTLTSQQANTLQRLFSRGLHPDISLLPYQMRRMKVDAPPKTNQNRKTIRMKNICYLNKKTFELIHISDNKYKISFEYSTTLNVYCSIYFFTNEITDKYNCTIRMAETYDRPIMDCIHSEQKNNIINIGTTYLLPKGYNLTFEQNDKDHMDLNAINYKLLGDNPALGYYPIIVLFSLEKPSKSLLCVENINELKHKNIGAKMYDNMDEKDKNIILDSEQKAIENGIQYVTKSIYYGKLMINSNNLYSTEIISQKTQVKNRAFESQDIYGLDRCTDPYSKEENLCVICMTMPRDTALSPCRHLCLCEECSKQLLKRSNKCPVCRSWVADTIKISRNNNKNQLL
eukprot:327678_1